MHIDIKILCIALTLASCTKVGPDFVKPETPLPTQWSEQGVAGVQPSPMTQDQWWQTFHDPVLNTLIAKARKQNNTLEIAGLRILEARATLGIAEGNLYPQSQFVSGKAQYTNQPGNLPSQWTSGLGLAATWEADFWGRFRRSIEAADASFQASVAARDQLLVLLTAQVADTYMLLRRNETLLHIANKNVALQQHSYGIAKNLFRNGQTSELDVQQALTLLLATRASIPGYENAIRQAKHALSTLLGQPPGAMETLLREKYPIPALPESVNISIPADVLRQRPDVRQAEFTAMAQNARVGVATADLYPSFSLSGSIGLAAAGTGNAAFSNLFTGSAFTLSAGPSFVWPFLNYNRIRNYIRVQDARLQQALIQYRETVIQAAREVEDAISAYNAAQQQTSILQQTVASAERSNTLAVFRYKEGFSDYQRVLDAQRQLFSQQINLVNSQSLAARSLINLYKALGGGWQQDPVPLISPQTRRTMSQRTDWGQLLQETPQPPHATANKQETP